MFNPLSVENVTSPFLGGKRILLEKGYNAVGWKNPKTKQKKITKESWICWQALLIVYFLFISSGFCIIWFLLGGYITIFACISFFLISDKAFLLCKTKIHIFLLTYILYLFFWECDRNGGLGILFFLEFSHPFWKRETIIEIFVSFHLWIVVWHLSEMLGVCACYYRYK